MYYMSRLLAHGLPAGSLRDEDQFAVIRTFSHLFASVRTNVTIRLTDLSSSSSQSNEPCQPHEMAHRQTATNKPLRQFRPTIEPMKHFLKKDHPPSFPDRLRRGAGDDFNRAAPGAGRAGRFRPAKRSAARSSAWADAGPATFGEIVSSFKNLGVAVTKLAECDVQWLDRADNKTKYTDFRRVLERKDIDVVAIATPPHWHALISIAAMEAGKDVLCEKPMTRFIAEGRAVANAAKRYGRIFQIGTFGRFSASRIRRRF